MIGSKINHWGTFYANNLILYPGTTSKAQISFASSALKTVPVAGDFEYSAGHFYITNGARHSITSSSGVKTANTTVANTTTETTIYSYTFAANELHADEMVVFDISGVVSTASAADDYTIRIKLAGVTLHTIVRAGGNVTSVGWKVKYNGTIRTDGASGTFVDYAEWAEDTLTNRQSGASTHSVDTTISNTFVVTVQWDTADAGNTITCTQGFLTFNH